MQKVPLLDRLQRLGEEGRLHYLFVEAVDASALGGGKGDLIPQSNNSPNVADKVWPPIVINGFSVSLWLRIPDRPHQNGKLFLLDLSHTTGGGGDDATKSIHCEFLCIWYDMTTHEICAMSSSTSVNVRKCCEERFPPTELRPNVWHHCLLSYQPPKILRGLGGVVTRKATLKLHIDGYNLQNNEIKVDFVNLPPSSKVHVGVPNPVLASSGKIRGELPAWEMGILFMVNGNLSDKDATSIYSAGPEFTGLYWGDRPQRMSLSATATSTFAMLAESGENVNVARALWRRHVPQMEQTQLVHTHKQQPNQNHKLHDDIIASVGLLCSIKKERVVFGFGAHASSNNKSCKRLINMARIHSPQSVSTDAVVYGPQLICPVNFADKVQWISGPKVLLHLVHAIDDPRELALALRLLREICQNQHDRKRRQ